MKTYRIALASVFGLSLVGCAPRQDPGIPLPDANHSIQHREPDDQVAKPQTPTTPMPQSGTPE